METKNEKTIETKNREAEIMKEIIEEDAEMQEQIFEEMYQERINKKNQENGNKEFSKSE